MHAEEDEVTEHTKTLAAAAAATTTTTAAIIYLCF